MMKKFYGKYRGKVAANVDPMNLGRVQVTVPSVLGTDQLSWAMPCVPYAGPQVGFLMLPPVNANVWIEFEGGESSYPIWSGCFWGQEELPTGMTLPAQKFIKTTTTLFKLDDTSGTGSVQITIKSPAVNSPLAITLDKNGMLLDASPATLKLSSKNIAVKLASASIDLSDSLINMNQGALEVK